MFFHDGAQLHLYMYLVIAGADPYIIIKCEGETVRTSTKQDTVNPEFGQSAIFYRKNPLKNPVKIQVCAYS